MSASFVDALLGYEFYLNSRGAASMEEINKHLQKQRRSPIAIRTYQHYRKLITHGFRSYVPINKFDVFQSLGKLQMAADRRRYLRRETEISAEISRNKKDWKPCVIIDMSLVGFGLETKKQFATRPGNLIWLRMDGYDPIPCFVAWRKHESQQTRLGLRAQEYIDNYRNIEIDDSRERLLGRYIIVRDDESDIDWGHLLAYLEKSDELIVSVKELILAVEETTDTDVVIPRSVLDFIQFGSPGGAEIKIDFGVADIIQTIMDFFHYRGLKRERYQAETKSIELDNQRKSLENADLKIAITRNAINLKRETLDPEMAPNLLRQVLGPPLMRALQIDHLPESIFDENSLESGILEERILPALAEVTNGDDPSYKMSIENTEEVSNSAKHRSN